MPKVILGLSGGVDSAVAALLLKKQGFDVIGVSLMTWDGIDLSDAVLVAESVGIPHEMLDVRKVFREKVINYFTSVYSKGETPNPCVFCNPQVKIQSLCERGGHDNLVATGHYAKIISNGERLSIKSTLNTKDQSYALCRLTQDQLKMLLFPCGDYSKQEVRTFAYEAGLSVTDKPDSQEICFIPDNDYVSFLIRERIPFISGDFIDMEGKPIGWHEGIAGFTIGQRKGTKTAFGERMYIKEIIPESNQIRISTDAELYCDSCDLTDIHYMGVAEIEEGYIAEVKIRYAHKPASCTVSHNTNGLTCRFAVKQRAVTPGQSAVIYKDGVILCSGIITRQRTT